MYSAADVATFAQHQQPHVAHTTCSNYYILASNIIPLCVHLKSYSIRTATLQCMWHLRWFIVAKSISPFSNSDLMVFICSAKATQFARNLSEFLADQASEIKRGDDDIVDGDNRTRLITVVSHALFNHARCVVPLSEQGRRVNHPHGINQFETNVLLKGCGCWWCWDLQCLYS